MFSHTGITCSWHVGRVCVQGGLNDASRSDGKCLVDSKRRHMRMFDLLRLANYDCQSKGKLIDR